MPDSQRIPFKALSDQVGIINVKNSVWNL